MLSSAVQEESLNCWYLIFYRQNKFHSQLSMKKSFIISGQDLLHLNRRRCFFFFFFFKMPVKSSACISELPHGILAMENKNLS